MGFYGRIYTALDSAIKRLKFKNCDKTQVNIPEFIDGQVTAESPSDVFTLQSGNAWLGFTANENQKTGIIYHAKAQTVSQNGKDIISGGVAGGDPNYDTLITFGDILTVESPTYDEAGHFNGYQTKRFKLEEVPDIVEIVDAVKDVEDLKQVVGVAQEPPTKTLLGRVDTLEINYGTYDSRIENLEQTTDTYLEIERDNEGKITGSNLANRTEALEKYIGNLYDTGAKGAELNIPMIFGDLSSVGVKPNTISVASVLGDLSQVSAFEHKNLAEILGNLTPLGETDFATELIKLRDDVAGIRAVLRANGLLE